MGGKMLEVLKEAAPQLSRVAVILNLDQPPHVALYYTIEVLGPSIGVRSTPIDAQSPADIERAIPTFADEPNGGLIVLGGPITVAHRDLIVALAARHRLPAIYVFRFFVTSGGVGIVVLAVHWARPCVRPHGITDLVALNDMHHLDHRCAFGLGQLRAMCSKQQGRSRSLGTDAAIGSEGSGV
jgi:hypothetical protein